MRDVISVYTEVANKIKNISDIERIMVVEGLAGKYHISRMQALLDDLGSADSMYRSMYETSVNSAGSAMEENEKYMDSLQARINLARVEVERLALSIGDAFLTEGMIQFLKISGDVLESTTDMVEEYGALPIVLGATSTVIFLMSKRFKDLVASAAAGTASLIGFKGGAQAATTWSNLFSASLKGVGVAMKSILASTGIGLVFVGIGMALEKVLSVMGDSREKAEELATANKKLMDSYSQNSEQIDGLVEQYNRLNSEIKSDAKPNTKSLEEYAKVQNELATLLPALKVGEDAYGNAILANEIIVNARVEQLKEMVELEEKLQQAQAIKDSESNISSYEGEIDSLNKQFDKAFKSIDFYAKQKQSGFGLSDLNLVDGDFLGNIEKTQNRLQEMYDLRSKMMSNGTGQGSIDDITNIINAIETELSGLTHAEIQYSTLQQKILSEQLTVLNSNIDGKEKLSEANKDIVKTFATLVSTANASKEDIENVFSTIQLKIDDSSLNDQIDSVNTSLSDLKDAQDKYLNEEISLKELNNYVENAKTAYSGLRDYLSTILAENNIDDSVLYQFDSIFASLNSTSQVGKDFNTTIEAANLNLMSLGETSEESSEQVAKLSDKLRDAKNYYEQLAGVSQTFVDDSSDLIKHYDMLSNRLLGYTDQQLQDIWTKKELTAEEQALKSALIDRQAVLQNLAKTYPELIKYTKDTIALSQDQIDAIRAEQKANETLLKAYKLSSEGKLTAEQEMTLAAASGTQSRISYLEAEIAALELVLMSYNEMTKAMQSAVDAGALTMDEEMQNLQNWMNSRNSGDVSKLQEYKDTLSGLKTEFGSTVDRVSGYIEAIEEADEAGKKKEKTTKSSIYITDKYKQALEKLNLEIEKQKSLREGESEHSDKYRKSLEAQIKLEQRKLELIRSQQSSLESQIKSGKILETGLITTESKSPTSTSKTNLSGYSGTISSRYGNRTLNGKSDNHRGIDIAQPMGTRLDANVSGKVVASGNAAKNGYDKSYGNLVVIQDGNGLKHLYAHLSEAIVKVGQQVSAGTQIGKIGSTGNSTGSHLHYEINLNGQTIDPSQYITDAKNGVVSVIEDTNDAVAKTQQNIDNAQSALIQSQQEELAQMKLIAELENQRAKSILSQHDYKRGQYDQSIEYESTKLQELDINSTRYTATLENMIKYMNKKQNANKQDLIDVQKMINSGKYHGEMLDWLKDRYAALTTEMKAQQIEINKTNFDIAMNVKAQSDEKISDIEYAMNRLKGIQSLYDEGSGDWVEIQEQLVEAQKKNTAEIKLAYENLQKEMTARSYTAEGIKDMTNELRSLSTAYWDSMAAEKAMTKSLKESQDAMLKSIADNLINAYKDIYNEKKDAHLKGLDAERDAEEKAHRQRIKELEDEMNLYRKNVQEKLDLINKQESERDYNMEISDLESERSKVAQKLNEVQFDNSYEGQAERKKLQEQLDKIDKDIAEKRHDRDIQLQTDALNEMLELKEQENQGFQDIETEKYEAVIDNIDRQKQYWEKYYNDILNDERKFAQIREDVMNKNFDAIKKEFGEYIDEMNATMPELEDTMDGTMQAVGTSIRMNIIDSLKEALALMAEFEASQAITGEYGGVSSGGGSGGSSGGSSAKSLSNGDKQVLLGKYMTEILANQESNAGRKAAIKNKAYELANSGRGAGSTIGANESLNSALSSLSKEDLSDLASFFSSRAGSVVSSPYLQDYIKDFAKQLLSRSASLSVGGQIPKSIGGIDGKGGRSVIVHPDEIISNPIDSKNMVIASNIMERITKMITSPKLSMPTSPSLASIGGGDVIFQVDKMYATEQEANSFGNKINSIIKTRFGGSL